MEQLKDIARFCNGVCRGESANPDIYHLCTDTRRITDPAHSLFVALKTEKRDGHLFIDAAYKLGIRSFLITDFNLTSSYPDATFIQVQDALVALQAIAIAHRKKFQIPAVAITGSNGKTVVKEWLYQLIASNRNTIRSPRSYNSQIGVPLSVWLMQPQHELAIFEAGISQPDEMRILEQIIQPTMGIFTNIGSAHNEGFISIRQKIHEKLLLFRNVDKLLYCKDHKELHEVIVKDWKPNEQGLTEQGPQLFTWSAMDENADVFVKQNEREEGGTSITLLFEGKEYCYRIPFIDSGSIENSLHCWCMSVLLNLPFPVLKDGMEELQPVAMRLQQQRGINGCTIINDSYNSDINSLQVALDALSQQKQLSRHTLILSDIPQAGVPQDVLYEELGHLIDQHPLQRIIGIGPALMRFQDRFAGIAERSLNFYPTTVAFLEDFKNLHFQEEVILLKGARAFSFEKIDLLLREELHQTVLSIDLTAMLGNLSVFRKLVGPTVKVMAMVKAFSYGSGSFEVAQALQFAGVDYLSVAYADEGIALRKAGITLPIMVMSPDIAAFERMISWRLEPEIFNLRSLEAFTRLARKLEVPAYPIHIKLDTGMHRLGFTQQDIPALKHALTDNTWVVVASIFSHLAASDTANLDDFTMEQTVAFKKMSDQVMKSLSEIPLRHLCNSAAIARHPDLHFDMVRLGVGLYGIDTSGLLQSQLQQIGTLNTTIAQIKEIPAGDSIGYGRMGHLVDASRIATISIGYADGYPRALGNGIGHVIIHGKTAKIVGVVCMDMCMVDISDIPEAQEGDEVLVFGKGLPVTQLAEWSGTIAYEIMTGISQRVKRVYTNES